MLDLLVAAAIFSHSRLDLMVQRLFRPTGSLRCPAWQALLALQLCQAYCAGSGQRFYLDSGERLPFLQAQEKPPTRWPFSYGASLLNKALPDELARPP
jgi:hypothetical protein